MAKSENFEVEGKVLDNVKDQYRVELNNGIIINAYVSGKMRMNMIRISPGDKVIIEISPTDVTRGRIIYRK